MQHPPDADAGDADARRGPPGARAGEHTALLHAAERHNKPVLSATVQAQRLGLPRRWADTCALGLNAADHVV